MNILVIGATGFIGTEVIKASRQKGYTVTGCGRSLWDGRVRELFHNQNEYWSLSRGPIPDKIWEQSDAVILLAAKRPYKGFGLEDYLENVRSSGTFLSQAAMHGIKNIVFASSKAVYSGDNMPWKEESACVPSSLYGASKLASEQVGFYYGKEGGFHFKSLRLAQVIGIGERKGYLINTLIDNAIAGKPQTIFGKGNQRRQYIYIKDVCNALLTAIKRSEIEGIFNIGIQGNTSNLELAEAVNSAFHNEGNIQHDMNQNMIGIDDEMDVTKAKDVLGFKSEYSIKEAFADIAKSIYIHDIS